MKTNQIITLVVSIVILATLGFGVWWVVKNKDAIFGYVNNSNIYTQEEYDKNYDNGYEQGYEDANNNEDYYKKLLAQYEQQIAEKNATIEEYITKQEELITQKNNLQTQLDLANAELAEVQPTIEALEEEIANNQVTINELESQKTQLEESLQTKTTELANINEQLSNANLEIEELQSEITSLEENQAENISTINSLKNELSLVKEQKTQLEYDKNLLTSNLNSVQEQLNNTQKLYENLQKVNSNNMETITNLNNQIVSLNSQITELTFQLQNTSSSTTALNNKIAELEETVAYYKQYIADLENGERIVATYEYDGSVINIQTVAPGSKLSIVAPEDTKYIILNGWQIDGQGEYINFDTFTISQNTYFVANLTYKYDVKFMIDSDTEHDTKLIVKNEYVSLPEQPTKEGYSFEGWSLDGVTILDNINSTPITKHTTYYAVWAKLHTVKFVEDSMTLKTEQVKNGLYANAPTTTDTLYKKYNGWKVNGVNADPSTYKILADTIFVADITYSYDVKFMVNDIELESQIIEQNHYSSIPEQPTKEGYVFEGWSLNKVDILENITTIPVTNHTTYYAVFSKIHTVTFINGTEEIATEQVVNGNSVVNIPSGIYKRGYTFKGWSIDKVNKVENINSVSVNDDTTYYALFEAQIGFGDGKVIDVYNNIPIHLGTSYNYSLKSPDKTKILFFSRTQICFYDYDNATFSQPLDLPETFLFGVGQFRFVSDNEVIMKSSSNVYLFNLHTNFIEKLPGFVSYYEYSGYDYNLGDVIKKDNTFYYFYINDKYDGNVCIRTYNYDTKILSDELVTSASEDFYINDSFVDGNNIFILLEYWGSLYLCYYNLETNYKMHKMISLDKTQTLPNYIDSVKFSGDVYNISLKGTGNSKIQTAVINFNINDKTLTVVEQSDLPPVNNGIIFERNGLSYVLKSGDFGYLQDEEFINLSSEIGYIKSYYINGNRITFTLDRDNYIDYYFGD